MSRCACEFEAGRPMNECQYHKEIRQERLRLANELLARPEGGGNAASLERCCLKCWLIASIRQWYAGGLVDRKETLDAMDEVTLQVLMADSVPCTKELN